jgi:methylglutaconyl-CoA hydratase
MMSKQAINRGMDMSRYNGFMQEGDLAHMLVFSEDRPEGLRAFAERRKPNFKGQ